MSSFISDDFPLKPLQLYCIIFMHGCRASCGFISVGLWKSHRSSWKVRQVHFHILDIRIRNGRSQREMSVPCIWPWFESIRSRMNIRFSSCSLVCYMWSMVVDNSSLYLRRVRVVAGTDRLGLPVTFAKKRGKRESLSFSSAQGASGEGIWFPVRVEVCRHR